jgi:putative multiple sugar transport system substrate-binding protein
MKKICVIFVVFLAASSFLFAAGGQQGGGGSSSASSSAPLIGIAMPETHVERWVKDGASLVKFAQAKGYRTIDTYGDANQTLQNQQMQNMITNGAKLIIASVVNDGANSIIAEAAREGIPIISYDRIIANSPDYEYYVTFDSFKVGAFQAQALLDGFNVSEATVTKPKVITLFSGSPTDKNAFWFFDGAMEVLNPYIEKGLVKVVGPYPKSSDDPNFQRISTENWQAPIAKTRMENLLNGDARDVVLDGVLAPNDTLARAIIEALRADAKYATKLPIVTGQDAEADSVVSIKNGQQYMTVFKDTTKLAEAVITLADQIIKGQPPNVPGTRLATEGRVAAMSDNGKRKVMTFVLEPQIITKDNWDVPLKAGFYTPAEEAKLK